MPQVKSLNRASEKWKRQSAASTPEYEAGVRETQKDWANNTAAAADSYAQGVQQAISEDRFSSGVERAGSAKWRNNTLTKGPTRWADGIRQSTANYEKGFAPYRQVIEQTQLPPRGPKGSAANIERVRVMAQVLHDAKKSRE
jgi:hypothetical protein